MNKAIIYVSGGCVVRVISNNHEFEYKIIDYDNQDDNLSHLSTINAGWYQPDLIVEYIEEYEHE